MRGLILVPILYGIGFGGFQTFYQNQMLLQGVKEADLGLLVSITSAIMLFVNIPTSYLADRYGRRKMILVGIAAMATAFMVPLVSFTPIGIAVAACGIAFADATISGVLQIWFAGVSPQGTSHSSIRVFKFLDQVQRLGMIFGSLSIPFLMAFVFPSTWKSANWGLCLLSTVILFCFVASAPDERRDRSKGVSFLTAIKKKYDLHVFDSSFGRSYRAFIICVFAAIFSVGFSEGISGSVFWAKIQEWGLVTPLAFGTVAAICSLARTLGMQVFYDKSKELIGPRKIFGCLFISSVCFFGFTFTSSPVLGLGVWVIRILAIAIYFPLYPAILKKYSPTDFSATFLSIGGVVMGLGLTLGALFVKHASSFGGTDVIIRFGASAGMIGSLMWFLAIRENDVMAKAAAQSQAVV